MLRTVVFATQLAIAISGCYASNQVDPSDAAMSSDASERDARSDTRDASSLPEEVGIDAGDASTHVALDAAEVDDAAAPPDAGRPACDPSTVVWSTPAPFTCGATPSERRIIATNIVDAWGAEVSAASCGLAVLFHSHPPRIGTPGGPWHSSVVDVIDYDGARLWSVTAVAPESWRGHVALPDGSVVVHMGTDWSGGWALESPAGERWRVELPDVVAYDPEDCDVEPDGTFHTFVQTRAPSVFGLADTSEDVLVDFSMTPAGIAAAMELARGAGGSTLVVRSGRTAAHVEATGTWRWADGTTSRGLPVAYTHFDGARARRFEDRTEMRTIFGHADGTSTHVLDALSNTDRLQSSRLVVVRHGSDGAVLWERDDTLGRSASPMDDSVRVDAAVVRPDGRTVLGGSVSGSVALGAWSNTGVRDGFLMELDPCGDVVWTRAFPSTGGSWINDLDVRPDGNVVATLQTFGLVDIDGTSVGDAVHYGSALLTITDAAD